MSATTDTTSLDRGNASIIFAQEGYTLKYLMALLEDTYFGILFSLQALITDRKLVRNNIGEYLFSVILDLFHIIPFLIHEGFLFGGISLRWAEFSRWIQLQLPFFSYADFQVAFWFTSIIMLLLGVTFVVFGISYWYQFSGHRVFSMILLSVLTTGAQIFFPGIVYILLLPWFCHPTNNTLINIPGDVACFGSDNSAAIALGTITILIVLFASFISSNIRSNAIPVQNDMSVTIGSGFRKQYYLSVIFMTINKFLVGYAINPYGHWWESLFNLLVITALVYHVYIYLPFQVLLANRIRGGIVMVYFWFASVSFMSVNTDQTEPLENRVFDYILIGGIVPFFLLGDLLIKSRIKLLSAIAVELVDQHLIAKSFVADSKEILNAGKDSNEETKEIESKFAKAAKGVMNQVAKLTKPKNTDSRKARQYDKSDYERNPKLYLPPILYEYRANVNIIDLVGRMLWHFTDNPDFIATARIFFEKAERAFPDRKYVKILRVSFLTSTSLDPSAHLSKLDAILKLEPSLSTRYYIFRRRIEVKKIAAKVTSEDNDAAEIVDYVEFQKYFADTQQYTNNAIQSIREFWMLFLQKSISFSAFLKATKKMENECSKAALIYKSMLLKYPKYTALLSSYAYFLDLIIHNSDEAMKYHRRAEEQRIREAEEAKANDGKGAPDTQGVIAISEDGLIEQINKKLLAIFGQTRQNVMGRNIKVLVPSPWKEHHDIFLSRYRVSNVSQIIGKPQSLYGHHAEGYAFSIRLLIQERRKENGERQFIGQIIPIAEDAVNAIVMINEMGIIKLVTKRTLEMFGYTSEEVMGENVKMLMIDSFAAGHDGYLKRYRDTGEARVIGTSGRNVPGKNKSGVTFPASLTVEEFFVDGERVWMANIRDTSNAEGVIFIDGFGTIQNADQGIQILLGYRKEEILGKNIKGIMPPPYCDYHDMYLERYRKTKVSNILRSVDGRILPAVHADGSVIQVRAIITRSDANDGSGKMLFKGTIKRGDLGGVGGPGSRKGFNEAYEIVLNKAGVIMNVSRNVLTMLGYSKERAVSDFVGNPIEVLIPAIPDNLAQDKNSWIIRALKNQSLNFYLLAVCKNYSVLPISYNLLPSKDNESIRMLVRDMTELDALVTIDEMGTILAINDDAFILLGFDSEDIIGRNINKIQPMEVAEKHDGYLLRYKETGVARVVGIAREVNTVHRDGSTLPIEIQVTEQVSSEGMKSFIGRIRHQKIEMKVPRDMVLKYYTQTNQLSSRTNSGASGSMSNSGSRRFKGGVSDRGMSYEMSLNGAQSTVLSGGSTTVSNKNRLFDEKFKFVKDSNKPDPSLKYFKSLLNFLLGIFLIIFIVGIIIVNSYPTPKPYYEFMDELTQVNVKTNELIFSARYMLLQQDPDVSYGPCSFDPMNQSACNFIEMAEKYKNETNPRKTVPDLSELLHMVNEKVIEDFNAFEKMYMKIRKPGDELDQKMLGIFEISQFVNGSTDAATKFDVRTLWNVYSLFIESGLILSSEFDVAKAQREWNFILGNRNVLNNFNLDLVHMIPGISSTILANLALAHLILLILCIAIALISYFALLYPQLLKIQKDREKILRLIVTLPKSYIYDLVYNVYEPENFGENSEEKPKEDLNTESRNYEEEAGEEDVENDEEDEDLDGEDEDVDGEDDENDDEEEEAEKKNVVEDVQEITIVPYRNKKLPLTFLIGLISLSIPLIVHVAWLYSTNAQLSKTIYIVSEVANLYMYTMGLMWRPMGLYLHCKNSLFCDPYPTNVENFEKNIETVKEYYDDVSKQANLIPALQSLFRNPITKAYDSPQSVLKRLAPANVDYLPPDYASKTTLGVGILINAIIESSSRLANSISAGTINDFWFLWEVLPNEAEAGLYSCLEASEKYLLTGLDSIQTGGNASYIFGAIYVFAVFWFIFGNTLSAIQAETKCSRNALSMVPIQVMRENKSMYEYVDNLNTALKEE